MSAVALVPGRARSHGNSSNQRDGPPTHPPPAPALAGRNVPAATRHAHTLNGALWAPLTSFAAPGGSAKDLHTMTPRPWGLPPPGPRVQGASAAPCVYYPPYSAHTAGPSADTRAGTPRTPHPGITFQGRYQAQQNTR